MNIEDLKNDSSYKNIDKIQDWRSLELQKTERAENYANRTTYIDEQDGLVDIYDHFTTFQGKKLLTTWAADRSIMIRIVELAPLTEVERKKPSKIEYPVQIHRRKPKY